MFAPNGRGLARLASDFGLWAPHTPFALVTALPANDPETILPRPTRAQTRRISGIGELAIALGDGRPGWRKPPVLANEQG